MTHRIQGSSSSPFYDAEFAAQKLPTPRIPRTPRKSPRKRRKRMPITQRTVERWTCDRCDHREEFPDDENRLALEVGWLQLDLTRSLSQSPPYVFNRNEQILCPSCVTGLGAWFRFYNRMSITQSADNRADDDIENSDEELHYQMADD